MPLRLLLRTAVLGVFWLAWSVDGSAFSALAFKDALETQVKDSLKTPVAPDRKAARFSTEGGKADTPVRLSDTVITGNSGRITDAAIPVDTSTLLKDTLKKAKTVKLPYRHQIRVGVDLARLGFNFLFPSRVGVEFQADYALRKNDVYLAAEAGYGRGNIDYSFLKYTTQSTFLRLGIEKSFLDKMGDEDFDIGFLGFRYGIASGSYSDAEFSVVSPFGGRAEGKEPGRNFVVHWGEIVGGVKVEVWRGIFLGWTVRGKFLFNPKQFPSILPNYIAGYGKGDRTSVFDFSFYLSYALRWTK